MPISIHSEAEWLLRKHSIEDLYSIRNFTMRQVRDHLCETGFHVNIRMVKNRLLRWNLHKKLSLDEVRAALELIGPDESLWPSKSPQFRIRRKLVSIEEVFRSCRRRGVKQPFDLLHSTKAGRTIAPDVELLSSMELEENESGLDNANCVRASGTNDTLRSDSSTMSASDNISDCHHIFSPGSSTRAMQTLNEHTTVNQLRDPEIHQLGFEAIYQLRAFCLSYMMSVDEYTHKEPLVHQFTSHARLQNHINEGLFYFTRSNFDAAFVNFNLGFLVLEEVLRDVHPMAMAMYFMLLCSLTAKQANVVARMLLRHTLNLASTHEQVSFRLIDALRAIYRSDQLLEMPLLCLKVASESVDGNSRAQWKALYIKERYCDALYHARVFGEAAVRRRELLEAQESLYDPCARNVLFTFLNVADDYLLQCRLDEAETSFNRILKRSESLSGFNYAKIRVVALCGLARTLIVRARQRCGQPNVQNPGSGECESPLQDLGTATDLVEQALELAQIWFEGSVRRIQVMYDLRADILGVSSRLGCVLSRPE